jgi:GAF domain-containing protein
VTAEVVALQADVDSLTGELLDRYEEITLLYDLAREMGVVVDLEEASRTALARSLQIIPARLGLVLTAGTSAPEQRLAGVLAFVGHDHSDRFSAAEVQLCAVVAGQLGQGIENARVAGLVRSR